MSEQDYFTVKRLLSILVVRKKLIFYLLFFLWIFVTILSLFIKPVYETSVTLYSPQESIFSDLNRYRGINTQLRPLVGRDEYINFVNVLLSDENREFVFSRVKGVRLSFNRLPTGGVQLATRSNDKNASKIFLNMLIKKANSKALLILNTALRKELFSLKKHIQEEKNDFLYKQIKKQKYIKGSTSKLNVSSDSALDINLSSFKPYIFRENLDLEQKFSYLKQLDEEFRLTRKLLPIKGDFKFYAESPYEIKIEEIYNKKKNFYIFSYLLGVIFILFFIILVDNNYFFGSFNNKNFQVN